MNESQSDIIKDLRAAQALYEAAGVDGCSGARMMKVAADEIERLKKLIAHRDALLAEADALVIWESVAPGLGRDFQDRIEKILKA